jgi:hypothetical protein
MAYTLLIDPRALWDVQQAIEYYDKQQTGLGKRFENALNKQLLTLERNPFFSIRYDDVRCFPIKKYPFMVHFTINDENSVVVIRAVFHTSLNPNKWKGRKLKP